MRTVGEIVRMTDLFRENAIPEEMKVAWISELDALIAADVMGFAPEELGQFQYDPEADMDRVPLVKFPYNGIYHYWLCAKIDAENGEYDKHQNSMQLYNGAFIAFRTWFSQTYDVYGTGRTNPGHYISAYGLALQQGFPGTLDEWLLSLVGPPGDPGYTPVKGTDYYTEVEKEEMVHSVLSRLPVYNGEVKQV